MRIIRSITEMQRISGALRRQGKTIGFVPTMGALHEGHLSLIRRSRKDNLITVVSIFVNPLQFGPHEDFESYPRPLKTDILLCKKEKVDFIFYPEARQMYPQGFLTTVEVAELGNTLCGAFRPGHFRGVTTIVLKLFNIVGPDIAYFGQKDAQQAIIIRRMAKDLNLALKIKVMPIIRGKDGLALSSRNIYLSPEQRLDSGILWKSLCSARDLVKKGEDDPRKIIQKLKGLINSRKSARLEYAAIVDMDNLKPVARIQGECLAALATRFGKTRLIDNVKLKG
jgi:pantoate--beta-alanine ligase